MSTKPEPPEAVELPPVGPIWSALRMLVQAWIGSRPRKEGQRFLVALRKVIDDSETVHAMLPLRPPAARGEVLRGQRLAASWLRKVFPLFEDSLPQKRRR